VSLRRIDHNDGAQLREWYGVYSRCQDLTGFGARWKLEEIRARAADLQAPMVTHLLVDDHGGRVVAVAAVEEIRDPARRSTRAELLVDPSYRRLGYGKTALSDLEEFARSLGRRELIVNAEEGAHEVGTGPSRHFAPTHGYVIGDEGAQRLLSWPRPAGELDRLEAQWRPFAAGYELVAFPAPTPPKWRPERVRIRSMMATDAPHVNHDVEEEVWTDEILTFHEESASAMGRDMFIVVAHHIETGTLVGYSELVVPRENPEIAHQYDTLVIREHRGHRLGGLMKIANMRVLERTGLAVTTISTVNSNANGPMIAVNEALGTTVGGVRIHWRRDL
jgi:GNAT superfamily N-acetyltransferase